MQHFGIFAGRPPGSSGKRPLLLHWKSATLNTVYTQAESRQSRSTGSLFKSGGARPSEADATRKCRLGAACRSGYLCTGFFRAGQPDSSGLPPE